MVRGTAKKLYPEQWPGYIKQVADSLCSFFSYITVGKVFRAQLFERRIKLNSCQVDNESARVSRHFIESMTTDYKVYKMAKDCWKH